MSTKAKVRQLFINEPHPAFKISRTDTEDVCIVWIREYKVTVDFEEEKVVFRSLRGHEEECGYQLFADGLKSVDVISCFITEFVRLELFGIEPQGGDLS